VVNFSSAVNKSALLKKIIAHLADEIALYTKAARSAFEEATHEQSRADNKYDTRGLEASYLARGQSKQVADTEQALLEFQSMRLRNFGEDDGVDLGALVELEGRKEKTLYFIGPKAGGTEIVHDKKEVLVITPQSPLGRQLMGRKLGDRLQLEIAGTKSAYRVASVS
jgi:transcription elongation GreA/GreB family factor